MAVRIYLEIGHEASIRTKKTQEGFTHDWEVFVRGCDGAEIHYFIEKVVFYLHETFPKPKRVVKEPPYSVKESGYAGFNLPIDIYLRNNNEPKKIRFNYDLHLQQSGPAILKVQKEKYVFNAPSEEFKMKLLKGGGSIGSSSSVPEVSDNRSSIDDKNQMTNKPKLGGCDMIKKQKIKSGEPCRDFQELFGSPITMSSKSSEQKAPPKQDGSKPDKADKVRTKHSPHKDGHKDKDKKEKNDSEKKSKDEKKKEKSKDRERSKDKSIKKDKSPRPKSPSPKRFSSPPVVKHKDPKSHDKEKREKFEDRKAKKEKRSKDHKENKHDEQKSGANDEHKEKVRTEPKKESTKVKTENSTALSPKVVDKKEKSTKEKSSSKESSKEEKTNDKYSEKYKHKKKDKEKREKKEEKSYKSEKKSEKTPESKPNLFKSENQTKKEKVANYLPTPIPNIDEESSNSSTSSSSSSVAVEKKPKSETIKPKEENKQKLKKEKGYQENTIKCKRKSNSVEAEEPPEKLHKEHGINNNSDAEQELQKTVLPPVAEDVPNSPRKKHGSSLDYLQEEDYFGVLRDLQHKIMGLKDNSDLQKVVKLIAETGKYEVSAHTFDFDLCLLERSTVQKLQEFFASET